MSQIRLSPPPDFRFVPTIYSHGWCDLLPCRWSDEARTLERIERLSSGKVIRWRVWENAGDLHAEADAPLDQREQDALASIIRRMLSMDHPIEAFYAAIRAHPDYAWFEQIGAGRMFVSPTVWEDLAKTLLTTNTTWTMTKGMVARLVTLGEAHPDGGHAFPMPDQIAALTPEALNAHLRAGYRGAYLHELAVRIASGALDVEAWRDSALPSDEVYRALKGLKGFGDYAAGAMMRLLGRFDQLGLDSVCRTMFAQRHNGGAPATDKEIAAYYDRFGKWRGLVVWMDVMRDDLEKMPASP